MLIKYFFYTLIAVCSLITRTWADPLIGVKFGVLSPNYKEDKLHGEDEKSFMEASLNYALGEVSNKLNRCGYKLNYTVKYVDNLDLMTAKEASEQLELDNIWFLIGPMRSDLFLLSLEGLKHTPAISLMANANAVSEKKPPIFTMSYRNAEFAKAALQIVALKNLGNHYGVFVNATCINCRDFANEFNKIASKKIIKVFSIDTSDSDSDISTLLKEIERYPIDFLFLPNFSQLDGSVMSAVHSKFPKIKFLGGNGWGVDAHTFITDYNLPNDTIAYAVRVGLTNEQLSEYYHVYSLEREWDGIAVSPPLSSYLSVELIRNISNILCIKKPKNKTELYKYLSKQNSELFRTKLKPCIYKIQNSRPIYDSRL